MNKTTRIRLRSGVLIAVMLAVTLTAYAVQRMNGLQIGPNPSTTNIDLQSDGDIIATGDVSAASFTGDGSGLTGVSGAAHTIEDEGTPLTARTSLNFAGAGVSAADSGGKTVVTISGGGGGVTDGDTLSTGFTFPNAGLHLLDTNASHDLILAPGSNITADRTITITTGDANRALTLSGDTTLSGTNTGDQTITLTGDVTGSGTGSIGTTIAAGAVDIAMLSATGTPDGTKALFGDNTWKTITGGGDALTTNTLAQFAATTSAQLRGVLSDETGTGAGVFADSPTLVTPNLGTPSVLVLTNGTGLPASSVGNGLTDAQVSDTLTASLFVGSGSTTSAIDLATAEVAGTLADGNVSDTLTASKLVGSGSTTDAVDLATAEVAGDLPLANIAQFAAGTFAGRALGGGTGDLQAMTNAQSRASLSNLTALTSTGNAVSWTAANASKFTHTLSENTTIGASTGADGQMVLIAITKASTYTFAWNAQFKALDGLTASIPAIPATAGDIGFYYFLYNEFLDDWILQFHVEYQP